MPVILLERDPFVDALAQDTTSFNDRNENVRRPFFGIQLKQQRFAFLSVKQANQEGNLVPVSMRDSSAPGGTSQANHNFILQTVAEQRTEKFQIVETFGDHFTFFFDERPVILQVSGVLFNTADFNWKNEWLYNYENFLRGTKCVEHRSRAYLGFDDVLVEGYVLTTNVNYDKDMPYLCPFSFQLLVTQQLDLSDSNNPVRQAEDGRTLLDDPGTYIEYVGGAGPVAQPRYTIDPVTGESTAQLAVSGFVPASLSDFGLNVRTAFWVSDRLPPTQQWQSEDDAVVNLQVTLASQEATADPVSTQQRYRDNPSNFPLGQRNRAVELLRNSLIAQGGNSAASIEDAPAITGVGEQAE